ncbi:tRNA (adenine(22)-N(1))-methyltransferase [Alkalicoccobacillus gibsonii]|jgi:tRNA (adenine22-N1)-methyltransferase|uniref:tRNA (adenine(22)-N(1))-methyltransferase n=1 Tax=Alkalicoccobacillus gibsonii TaxID=79881 RepID=UPI001932474A|nr:tRNA (adenine(22)-N(1))-methyltransferase TrmK [Alkalicoccobacillus gibsonii]MBM0064331.1 tRNA (adenine-N(1))-methyltransferase [Alkalicoccobacillus gibsonii]
MNEHKLSSRLMAVAGYVNHLKSFADIGSDHAYLPSYLCLTNPSIHAVAGEIVEGPFQAARKQVKESKLESRIDVRKGSGLEVIKPCEVEGITIAGMGGALIASILEEGKEKVEGVQRLVLQPNNSAWSVRIWLLENNWKLIDEDILIENEKFYEILVAEPGNDQERYKKDREKKLMLGPHLIKDPSQVFIEKWTSEKQNWERVLKALKQGKEQESLIQRKAQIEKKLQFVQEVLTNV